MEYFLSFYGRSNRVAYLSFYIAWIAIFAAYVAAMIFIPSFTLITMGGIGFLLLVGLMFISSFAIKVRRLHDINLSGWCVLMTLIVPIFALVLYFLYLNNVEVDFIKEETVFLYSLAIGIFLHSFDVMLLVWPGSSESNRFG